MVSLNSLWMSGSMLMVSKFLLYLLKGSPSGPIRNFSKFHEISVLLMGLHTKNLGSWIRETGSSSGYGSLSFRYANTGCVLDPLTSHFSKMVNEGSNPSPGRTCFNDFRISPFLQFSWRKIKYSNKINLPYKCTILLRCLYSIFFTCVK